MTMDKRAFIEFKPILDFNALEPGKIATDAIRQAATELNLAGEYGARVRLTNEADAPELTLRDVVALLN